MKGVACGKFIRCAQNWHKTCDHEKRIFWPVFGQNRNFWTRLFYFCSSLFLSIFGLLIIFGILWIFPFISLIFFLHFGAQKSNHRKYKLNQVKGVACGKFIRRAQNWQKTCYHEKRIFWPVFGQNKIFRTRLFHFCSSLFCLFLGCRYFFGILWLFPFISLIFFLHLGAQKK